MSDHLPHVHRQIRPRLPFASLVIAAMMTCLGCDGNGEECVNGFCQKGNCRLESDDSHETDVRIHVTNSESVANVSVTITSPSESCTIDELPVATQEGLELGQAVMELQTGDVVQFKAVSASGAVTKSCKTTAQAFVAPESAFVTLFITSATMLCDLGFEDV